MLTYEAFLQSKRIFATPAGFDYPKDSLHPALFPWQRDIVYWALRRGRAAIFADCGLGKTLMQLVWAERVAHHTGKPVLILAPLAVAQQSAYEADKFDIEAMYCREADLGQSSIVLTNYERLHHFDASCYGGLVADESSILKNLDGKTRRALTAFAAIIPYRLCCTATPAPNDTMELVSHAEFLSIMTAKELLALFFKQDGLAVQKWRLRRHAVTDFWRFMASWSVAVRMPSDLGYANGDFVLPPLRHIGHEVSTAFIDRATLFPMEALTLSDRLAARRESVEVRVNMCAALVNTSHESWVVWCHLNRESAALTKAIPDAVEVTGADTTAKKERALLDFAAGKIRVLVTKPSIAGFGMNWQHCHNMAFVGLTDSYEEIYQATRRCWRFGQQHEVAVHMISADTEGAVVRNIERKEREATALMDHIVQNMQGLQLAKTTREEMTYSEHHWTGKAWDVRLGDSVQLIDHVPDDSIGLTVTSPPFPGMYAYSNSMRDMGNVKSLGELVDHLAYLMAPDKLLRATMPGRSCCLHLTQGVAFKGTDGYIGLKDFRGKVIEMMEAQGWIYYGEAVIDKDPQLKAIRTKDRGLLFKTLATNSEHMHMALADYLLQFLKPGDSPNPIRAGISERYKNEDGWITPEEWIEWAAPVWYRKTEHYPGGIAESDVLNAAVARESDDERHLCPLQLGVCERAIKLWSAPGDLVFDPFAGIGSVGHEAIRLSRRFLGFELKRSYAETAVKILASCKPPQMSFFS